MKQYRVSLNVLTSLCVTGIEVADLLRVPRSALVEERVKKGLLWRYEPSTGQTGKLAGRMQQLAQKVRPQRDFPRGGGFRKVFLSIDVLYDTAECTVEVPLYRLLHWRGSLLRKIPELSRVDITCTPTCDILPATDQNEGSEDHADRTWEEARALAEAWEAAGRPAPLRAVAPLIYQETRKRSRGVKGSSDVNEYTVSLDADTSKVATREQVATAFGISPEALVVIHLQEGAVWSCYVEAEETVGLAEQIRFLTSQIYPNRKYYMSDEIERIFMDIGVFFEARNMKCFVSLPVSLLHALVHKLPVLHARVRCYPCSDE